MVGLICAVLGGMTKILTSAKGLIVAASGVVLALMVLYKIISF